MDTRKNDINKWALEVYEHQRKIRANVHFAIDVYGYQGLMSTWRKGAPGQMNTGANGTGGNEHCGQIDTLRQMDPGRDGDRKNLF